MTTGFSLTLSHAGYCVAGSNHATDACTRFLI
jgi:hypothetical protein